MSTTSLRQVLDYFETSREGISLDTLTRELDLSRGQVESMVNFWVRKGRLRSSAASSDGCASCGSSERCAFNMGMPASYELVE